MKPAIALLALMLAACTSPQSATRILTENGYKDVQITGYSWFACSKDDTYHTGFRAVSPAGVSVSGTVCAGLIFKNSTIRFD